MGDLFELQPSTGQRVAHVALAMAVTTVRLEPETGLGLAVLGILEREDDVTSDPQRARGTARHGPEIAEVAERVGRDDEVEVFRMTLQVVGQLAGDELV